jgi:hypothetical protein
VTSTLHPDETLLSLVDPRESVDVRFVYVNLIDTSSVAEPANIDWLWPDTFGVVLTHVSGFTI